MRVFDEHARRAGRKSPLHMGLLSLLSVVFLAFLAGCGAPASVWYTYPFINSSSSIMLTLAADPAHAGWFFAGDSQGDLFHLSASATRLPAPTATLPDHEAVDALAPDPAMPGRLYTAGSSGVSFSADSGAHWQQRDTGLPSGDSAMTLTWASNGHTLLVGTGAHGVYRTTNGGETWLPASHGLPSDADIYALYQVPHTSVILASALEVGLFATTDAGAHWAPWTAGFDAREIFSLLAAPAPPTQGHLPTLYAGTSQGFYASVNGGQTWTQAGFDQGLPAGRVLSLAVDARTPNTLYAGTDHQVYRSTDGGRHWSALGPGINHQVATLLVLPQAGQQDTIFAGAGDLYRYPRPLARG